MNRNRKKVGAVFYLAVISSLLLATSIALIHPAQWLYNNRDSRWLMTCTGILFWISLLALLMFQIIGHFAAKTVSAQQIKGKSSVFSHFFHSIEPLIFAGVFLVAAALTVLFLCQTRFSTVRTFLAAGFAVFGLANYINFNSRSYQIIRKNCPKSKLFPRKKKGRN